MAIPRTPDPSDPEEVGSAEFDTRRRGFDPVQVRAYLKVVARELARLRVRETELVAALDAARSEAAAAAEAVVVPAATATEPSSASAPAPEPLPASVEFDEARAVQLLGEETARVLATARAAAAEKVARAEEEAQAIVAAAQAEADAIRAGAQATIEAEITTARADGRALITEARLVRERMLDELAARRHALRDQLEQMRAGRDRLARSYDDIRRALDEVSSALDDALPEAQRAARRAAARHEAMPAPDAGTIERELDEAARAGTPVVTSDEVDAAIAASSVDDDAAPDWVNEGAAPPVEPAEPLFVAVDDEVADEPAHRARVGSPSVRVVTLGERELLPDEPAPPEIVLAEITGGRRDAGLPRVGVPIVGAPDAIETVRVLRPDEPGRADEPAVVVAAGVATAVEAAETVEAAPVVAAPRVAEAAPVVAAPRVAEAAPVVVTEPGPAAGVGADAGAGTREVAAPVAEEPLGVRPEPAVAAGATEQPVAEVPEPEPEPEPAAEVEPASEPEPAAEVEPEPQPQPAAVVPEPDGEPATPVTGVDDLFARIRRTRSAKVARAHQVLREPLFDPIPDESPAAAAARPTTGPTTTRTSTAPAGADEAPPGEVVIAEDRIGAPQAGDAAHVAARDRVLEPLQAQMVRKLKRLLADEQNDVLDLVRRSQGKVLAQDLVPEPGDHAGRYVAAIGGELLASLSAGATFFDGRATAADRADVGALERFVATEVVEPLRSLLSRAVDAADVAEDEQLDRVRSAYREVRNQRIDDAARALSLAAFNAGVEAAHRGGRVRWAVDPVHGCCSDCDDNALEGAIDAGLPFPTGATRPPAHPGCRCLLVPVDG